MTQAKDAQLGVPGAPKPALTTSTSLAVVLVLCFLPYLSFGPVSAPSQVQPWAALLAWGWVAVKALTTGLRVSGIQWVLLAFAAWFMLDVYGGEGFDLETYFRRSAAYLLSAGIFLACQYASPATLWRALKFTLPLWLTFAALRYASPSTYFDVVTPFVPTVVNSSERGSSSLAPEATDFGFMMAFLVVLCLITRRRLGEEGISAERWPLVVAVMSALLSQSGTGFIGLALVSALYLITYPSARYGVVGRICLTAAVVIPTLLVLDRFTSSGIRGIDLLSTAVRAPSELMQTTVSYRIAHNVVGFLGMLDSKLAGFGAGAFVNEATSVYYRHSVGSMLGLTGYYADNVPATLSQSPISQLAVVIFDFGIIGLIYLIVVFTFAFRSQLPYSKIATAILVVTWVNSFPAGWPPFWVLIGMMMSPHFRSKKSTKEGGTE